MNLYLICKNNYRNDEEKICFNTFVMYTFLYVIFPNWYIGCWI